MNKIKLNVNEWQIIYVIRKKHGIKKELARTIRKDRFTNSFTVFILYFDHLL